MNRHIVTPAARIDLIDIWTYLADNASVDLADRIVGELHGAMERIAELPGIGHIREDLGDDALRVVTVYKYLIIYRSEPRPVHIIRVVHGARDVPRVLEEDA